ncbi:HAMP domain-containing histidine kinase [Glycomyces sp. A-F 0318]|uniref:sensor histidine kinase n=1 Tax=Glycomyces amatae TaxID=2881355 RepID=UPI001E5112CF|nr:HAMP domain-containing sensor histidine kinase [Glycomyces amatae]MCD0447365.1 HAMP domain-containing histidine kinase [Glycomyces amatae]
MRRLRDRRAGSLLILAVALAAATALAAAFDFPPRDIAVLVATAAVASAIAGAVGGVVLRRLRGRGARVQTMTVALSSVLVAATGVVTAALAMFISYHDLVLLFVVLIVASGVAFGAAWQLGDDIGAGAEQVGAYARTMVGSDGRISAERAPAVTGPGELAALAGELADVSRRLEESQRRERALESSRRELITWVSHDLRAPLATIRAMSEALDDGVVDDDAAVKRYHSQIRTDAERLSALVDDLFELSRINSGSLRLGREKVDLSDAVADALAGAGAAADVKGVTVVERLAALPPAEVAARECCRALDNLFDNAVRHTPAGGTVVIEAAAAEGAAVLHIEDECGGIPRADLPRVFDIAFRGDEARRRDERGGGLGLAISRGLIEAHGGSVTVANTGSGCRFTVRVPAGGRR